MFGIPAEDGATPLPTRTAPHRDRVRAAIHLLDCASLYGQVFGLTEITEEYTAAALRLLEVLPAPARCWPDDAAAVSVCPCGRTSWLEAGATDEDRDAFDSDNADHEAYCCAEVSA